jgi:predicted kinase
MLYVITGPPCAGKSTWVRERAKPGDVVVDLDRIALALTSEDTPHHEYPRHIRKLAVACRTVAVGYALAYSRTGDSYVIHAKPSGKQKSTYVRARAQFVELSAPIEELMRRAAEQRPPWVAGMIWSWWDDPEQD